MVLKINLQKFYLRSVEKLGKSKILVVDDEASIRRIWKRGFP